ncbi:MAG: hypothetical protein JHC98_02960 [Thermoleophilaceae bacterium]|nr:hypothetical protein [Thermoleophilaceae bacterium]
MDHFGHQNENLRGHHDENAQPLNCRPQSVDSTRMRTRFFVFVLATSITVCVVAPGTAAAQKPILPRISNGDIVTKVSASGRYALLFGGVSRRQRLVVSRGQIGGIAERPATIGSARAHVFDPNLEIAPDGTAFVVFFDYFGKRGSRAELALATLKPGRKHATVQRLSRYLGGKKGVNDVTMAVDGTGRLAMSFVRETRTTNDGLVVFRDPNGKIGMRSLIVRTHGGGTLDFPLIKFDSAGTLIAVFNQGSVDCGGVAFRIARACKPTTSRIFASRVSNSGLVAPFQILTGATDCSAEALSAQPDGSSLVAMICNLDDRLSTLNYAVSVGGGPFTDMRQVSRPGSLGDYRPSVLALPAGRFVFVWNHDVKEVTDDGDFTDQIYGTFVSGDGTSLPSQPLSPAIAGNAADGPAQFEPTLATALGGKPYLMAAIPSKKVERVAHIRDDLTLGPAIAIAPAHAEDLDPGVAEDGHGLVKWMLYRGERSYFGVTEFQLPPD